MRKIFRLASVIVLSSMTFVACSQKGKVVEAGSLKSLTDSATYVIAYSQAMGIKSQGVELNTKIFADVFTQVMSGDTTCVLSKEQIEAIVASAQAASTSSFIQAYSIIGVTDKEKKKK